MVFLKPEQTYWYLVYVKNPMVEDAKWQKKFRRRFRMPYSEFPGMLDRMRDSGMFKRWYGTDAVKKPASPIELLLLGALRYLGRGLTFDDLEEYTAINEETHRQFFHIFIKFGAEYLYPRFVYYPKTAMEYSTHREEFNDGGLHGAGFSTDATNVLLWRLSHNLKQSHIGFKNSHPAWTYNLTCNHRRRIIHTTKGHPSRWNDKTLAWLDEFLMSVREGRILQDVRFKLFSWKNDVVEGPIKYMRYRGAWGVCDNGYHRWSCTQAPGKNDILLTEKRLSQWIESFQKDVEYVFGILKGWFRILKTGIRLDGAEAADNIWLTCCALHNLLLEVDGLDKKWEEGVPSDWEGELGDNDPSEMERHAPLAIQRLRNPERFGSREHENESAEPRPLVETGRISEGEDDASDNSDGIGDHCDSDGAIYINSLSYTDFRARLVVHFDILWRRHRIVWPGSKENNRHAK
jgi:DDE superfamily endonuclease